MPWSSSLALCRDRKATQACHAGSRLLRTRCAGAENDLVHVGEDIVHGLQIEPPAGNLAGLDELVVDREKTLRLALGLGDLLALIGFGFLFDRGRLAAGARWCLPKGLEPGSSWHYACRVSKLTLLSCWTSP